MRLGIDLGTTRTVVAAATEGRYPLASFDVEGAFHEWIPGVAIEHEGRLLFGWEALARARRAAGVVRSIKRSVSHVAPDDPITELPSRPSAIDLLTGFVAHLRGALARSSLDADGELEATIAVPANATSRQRWITVEAFRRAGFDVRGVLNEPTAAGIEFAHRHLGPANKRSPKRYLVVYDLGGGTFDASAISLADRRFELLCTEGLSKLGGDDLDEAILALALRQLNCEVDLEALGSTERAALLEQARAAKEAMTPHTRNVLVDPSAVLRDREPVVIEAAKVLAACEPIVLRTMDLLDALMSRLPAFGIDPENSRELGAIYVVGGAASFVGVARALRAKHGRKMQLAPQPHASTAIGLAIAGDPEAGLYVSESVTRHFGVWREGQGGREKVFDRIFDKGSRVEDGELVVRRRYRPRHTVGHLRFLECSSLDPQGGPAGDLLGLREVLFPYDPSLCDRADLAQVISDDRRVGGEEIEEVYRYEPSGEIRVRIENRTRGYAREYELGRMA
ncbi:MAG: Hsp70 family protein [Sandaracinaceae bacterium]|nr:Hsp70 family protein [Sandaracinaceae bacterium]